MTRYYEITTANSTYFAKYDDRRDFSRYYGQPSELRVWGPRFCFEIETATLPKKGQQMHGTDAMGSVRTSTVESVRRISRRKFEESA